MWVYCWYGNDEQYALRSVDLNKLKEKVLNKGLKWREFTKMVKQVQLIDEYYQDDDEDDSD